jgi:monovalent cation/hydrogen antiporter
MQPVAVVLALLSLVVGITALARRVGLPYPILLVIGGLALSLVPGLPRITLAPDVVFFVFLPPLIFSAGYLTSLRDFRTQLRPIGVLAVGLVLATIFGVAGVAHAMIPGLGWPAAFVLGAVVSPTDPVAATVVARRLGVSRRVVTILEGESVVNDATGLAALHVAVAAAVVGVFSVGAAALDFGFVIVVGGIVGVATGWCAGRLLRLTNDELTTVALTLLTPYAAYLLANVLGVSGILSAAAAGVTLRQFMSRAVTPQARVAARAVWDVLVFLLNGTLFILTGLALSVVWPALSPAEHATPWMLLGYGALISAVVIAIRLAWIPFGVLVPRWLHLYGNHPHRYPEWRETTVIGWSGMRGVLSLAAALALPVATQRGAPFPARALILYLTFAVILVTLVFQGGTLPLVLRRLGARDRGDAAREEASARLRAADAALERLEELRGRGSDVLVDQLQDSYRARSTRLADGSTTGECEPAEGHSYAWLRQEALTAERHEIIALRDIGAIGDDVLQALEYELDVEALRLAAAYPTGRDFRDPGGAGADHGR